MTERSRDSAWKAIAKKRLEVTKQILDQHAREMVTEQVVKEIFDIEWSSQFEDDRGPAQTKIKQIVNDCLDEQRLREGST